MAIVSVKECFGGRSGSIDNQYARTYVRIFDVETSDPVVGWVAVRSAVDPYTGVFIPGIGIHYDNGAGPYDPLHEYDFGSFVNSSSGETDGSPTAWKVTVNYAPWPAGQFDSNPINHKLRVKFAGERIDRIVDFDNAGNPIINSAGDRFGDPVVVDDSLRLMIITRNELVSDFDPETIPTYSYSLNNGTWNGFAAHRCKMGLIESSDEQWDPNNQVWYYTITYPVQVEKTGEVWSKKLLDQGYNVLEPYGGGAVPYMPKGQPVSDPVALDGAGNVLGSGGSPVVLDFDVFPEANWATLGIDLSLRLGV